MPGPSPGMTAECVAPHSGSERLVRLRQLGAVANVDQHGVALGDHVDRLLAGDLRHHGIGGIDEGFGGGGHGGRAPKVDEVAQCRVGKPQSDTRYGLKASLCCSFVEERPSMRLPAS